MRRWMIGLLAAALLGAGWYFLSHSGKTQETELQPAPQQAVQGKLQGRVIAVDPGHGGYDGGARADGSRVWEKGINLQVALEIRKALEQEGAQVILTREEDMALGQRKRQDLDARLEIVRQGQAEMLLSVHMNKYHSEKESGPQVFYRKNMEESRLLAGVLQQALIDELQPPRQRSAMAGDYYMLQLEIPSVLVECGFLSNPREEKLLQEEEYQGKLAGALCRGICEYFSLQEGQGSP